MSPMIGRWEPFLTTDMKCISPWRSASRNGLKNTPPPVSYTHLDVYKRQGQLRIRLKGSAGGHNGLKNIISHLGTQEFPRIRIGVGEKPRGMDLADYVLGRFPKEQQAVMEEAYRDAADAACMMIEEGADAAMNHYNSCLLYTSTFRGLSSDGLHPSDAGHTMIAQNLTNFMRIHGL